MAKCLRIGCSEQVNSRGQICGALVAGQLAVKRDCAGCKPGQHFLRRVHVLDTELDWCISQRQNVVAC
ncbi:hypothetical protein BIX27_25115 [Salmonella enterica]|nr:hypothetical protein [Salmonella enterica]